MNIVRNAARHGLSEVLPGFEAEEQLAAAFERAASNTKRWRTAALHSSGRHLCRWLLAGLILWLGALAVGAAPFARDIAFTQPDGTQIKLWGEGDEFHAVFETLDGYTVVFDPGVMGYCFARLDATGNEFQSTGSLAGRGNGGPPGVPKHLRRNPAAVKQQVEKKRRQWEADLELPQRWNRLKALTRGGLQAAGLGVQSVPTLGTKVGLTLLVDFDDDPATISRAQIISFLNSDGYTGFGNNGSVKEYFRDNSNGQLIYTNYVTVYLRIPNSLHPKSWYNDVTKDCGGQGNLLIRDAITVLKSLSNYNSEILPAFNALTVDDQNRVIACNVFYAGGNGNVWSKGLWPHSWVLANVGQQELSPGGKTVWFYQITDIGNSLELGTFCHENGHMLCDYPDIYDYDGDSKGGAGRFCLMDSGGHGPNPVQICAYLKYKSGWTTITELTSNTMTSASLTADPGAGFNHFYRYAKPGEPTEYFLVENRHKAGRDASIPVSGIAVWHVDELGDHDNQSLTPNTAHHNYEVTLVQADNRWDFENNINDGDSTDLYYAGNAAPGYANRLSDTTSPHTHWWNGSVSGLDLLNFSAAGATMTFQILGSGNPMPAIITPPRDQFVVAGANAQFDVEAAGESPLSYRWRRDGANLTDGGRITGSGTTRLIVLSAQTSDTGKYDVVVSNSHGSVTSAPPANLTIVTAPVITRQPAGVTTNAGYDVTFSVTATGVAPLGYQWRKNLTPIPGATGSSYTLAAVQTNDTGSYSVTVNNTFGSVTSSNAVLSVIPTLSIGDAVDQPGLPWTTGGSALWTGQSMVTFDGQDAAASPIIGDDQTTYIQTTVTGPINIVFWWKVSSEDGYDFLEFRVNDSLKARVSGERDWQQRSIFIPAGPQILRWVYTKDYSVSLGADRGWVDQITFAPPLNLTLPDALDAPSLTWSVYGHEFGYDDWFAQADLTHDDVDAGQSGAIFDLEFTGVSLAVTGPGTLSFWWKVSSEPDYDFLDLYLDNFWWESISGDHDWERREIHLGSGVHNIDWEYAKDESVSLGYDAAWLDQVVFVPDSGPPQVVEQPAGETVEIGEPVTFSVVAIGSGTLSYQWRKGAASIPGATGPSLMIPSAQIGDAGAYSVVVNNLNGSVTSSNAVLAVFPPIPLGDAVDAPALTWLTDGDASWKGESGVSYDGIDAARSGIITHAQQTTLKTTVTGPGTVSYWWKVSSEFNYDYLYFYVSGIERARISGEVGWQERTFNVPEGSQTLEWVYVKDPTVSGGLDMAWVDQVSFGVSNPPPVIVASRFVNDVFSAAVMTVSGRSYVLEYTVSLGQPNWMSLPPVAGDGTIKWLTDPAATSSQRIYRVRVQ